MVGHRPTVIGVEDGYQQVHSHQISEHLLPPPTPCYLSINPFFHHNPLSHLSYILNPLSRSGSLALGKPLTLPYLLLEGSKFLKWTDQVSLLQLIIQVQNKIEY